MKYIQLNNTDLDVSRICLGTAGFGDKLDQARQAGTQKVLAKNAEIEKKFSC